MHEIPPDPPDPLSEEEQATFTAPPEDSSYEPGDHDHIPEPDWTEATFTEHLDQLEAFDYDSRYYRSALEFDPAVADKEADPKKPLPVVKPRKGVVRALTDVVAEPISWLWPSRIALGSVTILDGDPGVGKTTLAIDLAARLSTGRNMPFETKPHLPASNTLLVSAEDNPALTLRPRAEAAGGDLTRIFVALDHCWLPTELGKLQQMIHDASARLVILDPGIAFFDSKVDSNSDQQVRRVVQGLSDAAAATHSAIIFVRHLNKAQRSAAMYRGGGSIAIAAAARNCLLARIPGRNQSPILASYKSNLSRPPQTLSYDVLEDKRLNVAKINWLQTVDISADDALAGDVAGAGAGSRSAQKQREGVDREARMTDLQDKFCETLLAYPDGLGSSALRMLLKVKMERLYGAATALLNANRIMVDGTGPQRKYRIVPQHMLGDGEGGDE